MEHLAVMDKTTINKILNGQKLIESRFSQKKIAPFNKVKIGDIVYLKEASGHILASFEVGKVLFWEELNINKMIDIKSEYGDLINASNAYWDLKKNCLYGTLIFIKHSQRISPLKINKKNRAGFVSSFDLFKQYKVEEVA